MARREKWLAKSGSDAERRQHTPPYTYSARRNVKSRRERLLMELFWLARGKGRMLTACLRHGGTADNDCLPLACSLRLRPGTALLLHAVSAALMDCLSLACLLKPPTQNPSESTRIHQNPPESIRIHQNPPESTRIHQNPPESTRIHQNPLESARIHQNPPESTRIHQNPPESTRIHQNPPESTSESPIEIWRDIHPHIQELPLAENLPHPSEMLQ